MGRTWLTDVHVHSPANYNTEKKPKQIMTTYTSARLKKANLYNVTVCTQKRMLALITLLCLEIGEVQIVAHHHKGELVSGEDGDVAAQEKPEDEVEIGAQVHAKILVQRQAPQAHHHAQPCDVEPPLRLPVRRLLPGRQADSPDPRQRNWQEPDAHPGREQRRDDVELLLEQRRGDDHHGYEHQSKE